MKQKVICKKYCRRVKAMLPCDRRTRRSIMARITASVAGFLESCPNADYPLVVQHFGKPEEIAAAYLQELDTAALLRSMRVRKRIVRWVAGGVAAVLLAFCVFMTVTVIDAHASYNAIEYLSPAENIPNSDPINENGFQPGG